MLKWGKIAVAALIISFLVPVFGGCGPTGGSTASPKPAAGPTGTLTIALSTLGAEVFWPPKAAGTEVSNVILPTIDFLIKLDKNGDLGPGIAEKWAVAADGLSWTFNIRKGVKFHNGDPLTAKDVKFSLEAYSGSDAIYRDVPDNIKSIDIVDDYTLRITTKAKNLYFPNLLQDGYPPADGAILPMDYVQKNDKDYFDKNPVGSGPFKFVSHAPGDNIKYEAVTQHWRQVPEFKNLNVLKVPEDSTRQAMMKTGAADAIDTDIEGATELEKSGYKSFNMTSPQVNIVFWGPYRPEVANTPISSLKVRQAMSLAINREEIRKTFFMGKALAPSVPFITLNAPDVDRQYWLNYAANIYKYDTAAAKKLLQEAGYGNGFTVKFWSYSMSDSPYLPKLAEVIQGYWAAVGIKAEIATTDWGVFKQWRYTGPDRSAGPEIRGMPSVIAASPTPPPTRAVNVGYTRNGINNNLSGAGPNIDDLIAQANAETDAAKRKQIIADILKIGTDTYTYLPIANVPQMAAVGPKVTFDFPSAAYSIPMYAEYARHK